MSFGKNNNEIILHEAETFETIAQLYSPPCVRRHHMNENVEICLHSVDVNSRATD